MDLDLTLPDGLARHRPIPLLSICIKIFTYLSFIYFYISLLIIKFVLLIISKVRKGFFHYNSRFNGRFRFCHVVQSIAWMFWIYARVRRKKAIASSVQYSDQRQLIDFHFSAGRWKPGCSCRGYRSRRATRFLCGYGRQIGEVGGPRRPFQVSEIARSGGILG